MPQFPFHCSAVVVTGLTTLLSACQSPSSLEEKTSSVRTRPTLFILLPSEQTGVIFANSLTEGLNTNVLMYEYFYNGEGVAIGDLNNNGLHDIYTLDMLPEENHRQKLLFTPDNYEKFELNLRVGFHYQYMRNMLQVNNGNGTFSEVGQLAGISNTDWSWAPLFADYDNDGWKDLYITNGYLRDYTNLDFIKYMEDFTRQKGRVQRTDVLELVNQMLSSNVVNYIYQNNGNLTFTNKGADWGMTLPSNSNGAAYGDLDNDGDVDLVVNINQPAFIHQNQANQQLKQHYLQVRLDPLLCFYLQGKSYPYVTRDELLNQISMMRTRFANYKSYADAILPDIFTAEELKGAGHLEANFLQTALFLNNGKALFIQQALPLTAQTAPIYALSVLDYNRDGNQDLLLADNINKARLAQLRFGKSDANYGLLLQGNGKGRFTLVSQRQSGLALQGDVRCLLPIRNKILVGINGQALQAVQLNPNPLQ